MYVCVDLKSYYASVECVARGLDPLAARLLVADESRSDKTICLAVSPALKALGVPSRPRLFEAKQAIRLAEARQRRRLPFIIATPRMAEYERVSALIYAIYLKYVAPEDIHVYHRRGVHGRDPLPAPVPGRRRAGDGPCRTTWPSP